MSYIAFDLDALNRAPAAARAAGVPEEHIIAGLVRMWAWCFREKETTVNAEQIRGHFGCDAAQSLVAFKFLEPADGAWRVKGTERYLRIAEARSKGGKAAAANLKRGAGKPKASRGYSSGSSPAQAGEQPSSTPGLLPALTPSTEHRAPNEERSAPTASTPAAQGETELLRADFQQVIGSPYLWQGAKDGVAFANLKKLAPMEEIRKRWCRGLRAASSDWASCRTVAQLASKWNDLAADAKAEPAPRGSVHPKTRELL